MSGALEAVLRRDRTVVFLALVIIARLGRPRMWLANDMWMDGMDMTGLGERALLLRCTALTC
jgi:hypothetical protein